MRRTSACNQNGHYETVHGDDTRHDDGDKGLRGKVVGIADNRISGNGTHFHDELRLERAQSGDTNTGLRCSICCTDSCIHV